MYQKKPTEEVTIARRKAAAISAKIRHAHARGRRPMAVINIEVDDWAKIRSWAMENGLTIAQAVHSMLPAIQMRSSDLDRIGEFANTNGLTCGEVLSRMVTQTL